MTPGPCLVWRAWHFVSCRVRFVVSMREHVRRKKAVIIRLHTRCTCTLAGRYRLHDRACFFFNFKHFSEKKATMLSLIDTPNSSLLANAAQTLKPSGMLTLDLVSQVSGTPVGICVEGAFVHKFLVLTR